MLGIMLEKMWHKKWMNICLLLGCILLTATVVSFPLYRNAAYDRMINDEFENYISSGGEAKYFLAEEKVYVNNELETRRGRKLRVGDIVRIEKDEYLISD